MIDHAPKRPEINLDKAKALGLRFCAERNARNLSHQDIADELLLSKLQAIGLENADLKSFYSAKMFAQAADKFAKYLGFEDKPSEGLFASRDESAPTALVVEPIAEDLAAEEVIAEPVIADALVATTAKKSRSFRTAFVTLLTAGVVVALYLAIRTTPTTAAPQPEPSTKAVEPAAPTPTAETASPQPPAEKAEPLKTEPVKSVAIEKPSTTESVTAGHIQIKFNESSWVQSVDKNGSKQEKVYRSGDALDLEPAKLQALVIGNASAVAVNGSKGAVSLKPYIAPGSQVARIIGSDIRKLGE